MNLTYLAVFGMFLLVVMSLVSNSGEQSIDNIEEQMYLLNCPDPIYDGVATLQTIEGFRVNYTTSFGNTTEGDGTFFICSIDDITGNFQASTVIKPYGSASFFDVIPIGWLGYVSDWISNQLQKVQAFFTLLTFVLIPVNFSILGYTLADLSGVALMVVIALYAFAYIFIGAWLYKTISPFAGGGG